MSSDSSVHKGHRKTLKKKFIENGLDVFEPHEALELYLYYAIIPIRLPTDFSTDSSHWQAFATRLLTS